MLSSSPGGTSTPSAAGRSTWAEARTTPSLLELIGLIQELHGKRPEVLFEGWRTGDQRYYVSDTRRFQAATGWHPRVNAKEGVGNLYNWLADAGLPSEAAGALITERRRAGGLGTNLG